MALIKRLSKLGNSSALVIDKSVMELLGMEPNCAVEITIGPDAKTLVLRPLAEDEVETEGRRLFEKAKQKSWDKHGETYKKLADR
jgi:antitoxin component of MazEF toxin-antitoxin module